MKLDVVRQALEMLIQSAEPEYVDKQQAFVALQEINNATERATDFDIFGREAYIISASNMHDIMINSLYGTYASRRKIHGADFPVSYFQHDARKIFGFEDFTNDQLQVGYDIISDLWNDNEATGEHNEDGILAYDKLQIKLTISSAECNCLIEAITEANLQVYNGKTVYAKDGYETKAEQTNYARITSSIARALQGMVANNEPAMISFEP